MPTDPPIKPQDIPPNEIPEKRSISPMLFLVLAATGVTVVLGGFVAVFVAVQPDQPLAAGGAGSTALQTITMPDGGTLVLEAVTWGFSHEHEVKFTSGGAFSKRDHISRLQHHTHPSAFVVWLSCYDEAGRVRDFRWWSHAAAVGRSGAEIRDKDALAQQFTVHEFGNDSHPGRPFPATGSSKSQRIVATTTIPPLRHQGDTFPLRIYDTSGNMIGEFTVPDPSPANGKYPEWKPEELPITKDLGNGLSVTLASLRVEPRTWGGTRNGVPFSEIKPWLIQKMLIYENGELTQNKWSANSVWISDTMGNKKRGHGINELTRGEPAWRLTAKLHRTGGEESFDESEIWQAENVTVAPAGKQIHIGKKVKRAGAELEIIATGGPGKTTYQNLYPSGSGGGGDEGPIGREAGDTRPPVNFVVQLKSDRHAPPRLTVDCPVPHFVFCWSATLPLPRVTALRASDDQGRRLLLAGPYPYSGGQPAVYFLRRPHDEDSEDPIKSVNVTFIVNRPRELEFFIKPPELKRPPLPPHRLRTREQRLAAAAKRIADAEANLKQAPGNAQQNNSYAWVVVTAPEELRTVDRTAKALECAQLAARSTPGQTTFSNTLAMALLRVGKLDEAKSLFSKNLTVGVRGGPAYDGYGLAVATHLSGEEDAARKIYEEALRSHHDNIRYVRGRNDLYELRDEIQTLLLKESPRSLMKKANDLVDKGANEEAAGVLDQLLAVQHHNAWALYSGACLQAWLGNVDAWQDRHQELALKFRDSDDPLTLNRVGKASLLLGRPGDLTEARRAINRANVLQPDDTWIVLSQSLLSYREEEYANAIAFAKKALTFKNRTAEADVCLHVLMAMAAFSTEDNEAAMALLSEATRIREEKFTHLKGEKSMGAGWPNILVAEMLYREAESMILEQATPAAETPATGVGTESEKEKAAPE